MKDMSNREVCEHCEGSGQCPDCDGVGYVTGPTENPDEAPSVGGQQQNAATALELRHAGSATMETRSGALWRCGKRQAGD